MTGTPNGGKLSSQTIKEKYGKDYFKELGRKGGKTKPSSPRGFAAATPEERAAWGKLGGISRRKK